MGPLCDDEPKCYIDAQGVAEWEVSMKEEIEALHKNGTWGLVSKPKDVEIITCQLVYKLKKRQMGWLINIRLVGCTRFFPRKQIGL